MSSFHIVLVLATLLTSLVAGFLFAFATVVMPGLKQLDDGAFIRAFQVIDRIVQHNQPMFMTAWVGSVFTLTAAAIWSVWQIDGIDRVLLLTAAVVYLAGVQATTGIVNIPLNNRLQRLDVAAMDAPSRRHARDDFEDRWNRWNVFRTACAGVTALMLTSLLART